MPSNEILIQRGKTFNLIVRYEDEDFVVRKPITEISLASGAPRITVAAHGAPDGWRGKVYAASGMKQINDIGFQQMRVIDANTIEFNSVTPVDDNGKMWADYTGGGFLMFYAPIDLTGCAARMDIKDKIGGTLYASSSASFAPKNIISISIDTAAKTISASISQANTAALTFKKGVTEMELTFPSGDVSKLKLTDFGNEDDPDPVRVTGEVPT